MSFRITSSMLGANYLRNINSDLRNMKTLQNQLASGKVIQKASDNPYTTSRSMQLHTEISFNKQYNENIKDVSNWLDTTDTALAQMGNIFGRIESLLVAAGNAAYGEDERLAIRDEIKERVNELSQVLNTNFDGDYIFGGTKTNSKPVGVIDGMINYTDKEEKSLQSYIDLAGGITELKYSPNKELNSDLYIDKNGNITTLSKAKDNTANVSIVKSNSLYIDATGNVTSSPTKAGVDNTSILLKDSLYVNSDGNVTGKIEEDNDLIDSSVQLYVDSNNNITTIKGSNRLLDSKDTLYRDDNGHLTLDVLGASGRENTLIESGEKLYSDSEGNVVISSTTKNKKLTTDVIYSDSNGLLTINDKDPVTGNSNNGPVDLTSPLYIDGDLNIKNTLSVNDKKVILATDLYVDGSGNVTVNKSNQKIASGDVLYKDSNGNITTLTQDVGGIDNTKIVFSDKLYKDFNDKITTQQESANEIVKSGDLLYVDKSGLVVNSEINSDGEKNDLIKSDAVLYIGKDGKVTTNGSGNKLLTSGQSLYFNGNGTVTIESTEKNAEISEYDKIYVDQAGNTTLSETTENKMLSLSDIHNLEKELNDINITNERKNEINSILDSESVVNMLQINSELEVDISQGVKVVYNKTASDVLEFEDKEGQQINVSELLNNIIEDLGINGDKSNLIGDHLKNIQSVTSNLLQQRSEVGSMQNRMESAQESNEDQNYNMTDILSKTEDIDFTEKTMEYSVMQTVYMAALQTSAKILPQTILNYL